MDYFEDIPPELLPSISQYLSIDTLNALVLTCRRLHTILQPELEARITPENGWRILLWAAAAKPHVVAKLLSPPHSISPGTIREYGFNDTPLHIAAETGSIECAELLLRAGAYPSDNCGQEGFSPLHLATINNDVEMAELLLDYRAIIDDTFGGDGFSENALHRACASGHLALATLLLDRGANLEYHGHYGTPLGFAVRNGRADIVDLLLARGADASVTVSLYPLLDGSPPYPRDANLLYVAMDLRHPSYMLRHQRVNPGKPVPKWDGLPLSQGKKYMLTTLMAQGASKDATMATISNHLRAMAEAAGRPEKEFLDIVKRMLKEAENAMTDPSFMGSK
ncbi:hypothetical protein MVEN_02131100 [Mycena venus]|uniref:F-box domain-containing protein n=1 Tax=Mycena venus TaxID=2733690 RepID=A0A8H6X9H6_9AGAR|nr:hypothetical protein MVEN_02131100 [Mycena venus]